jgi:hypothetical protein
MSTIPVHLRSLQRRIDDLDKRLDSQPLNDQERHDLKVERVALLRSIDHYYRCLLKGAA